MALACLGLTSALTGTVQAAPSDYALDTEGWNGIGYLVATGTEAKVDVQVVETLDFEQLRPDDVLLWLYPTGDLPIDQLLAFIEDGGHLVLADDHGRADPLLAELGIERRPHGPTRHRDWYQGQDGLPIVKAEGDHFLFFNVEQIVANHPAVLTGSALPILSFGGGEEHLVVEQVHGRGAVLALSDPSVFVNQMLRRFYGNKQFAANVMRLYCDRDPCRVKLLLPATPSTGSYRPTFGPLGQLPRLFDDAARLVDGALADVSDALAEAPWSTLVLWSIFFVALALAAYALAPGKRPTRTPPLQAGIRGSAPMFDEARGLGTSRTDADFHHLARTLAQEVETLRHARWLVPGPNGRTVVASQGRGASEASPLSKMASQALLRIDAEAASLQGPEPPMITAERFVRMSDDVNVVLRAVAEARGRRRQGKGHAE